MIPQNARVSDAGVQKESLLACFRGRSALLEALNAASLVEGTILTGIERVRLRGDLDDVFRVLLAFKGSSLRRTDR